jgi:hypothetical protein
MKAQTRRGAATETFVNLVVGFGLSYLINLFALPAFGMEPTHQALFGLGALFTIASIIRSYILRRVFERLRVRQAPPEFLMIAELLAKERHRQISGEGYDLVHDDAHTDGQLARAAIAYAIASLPTPGGTSLALHFWPWDRELFRSTTAARDLEKSGALIIAEIGRHDRAMGRHS